MFHGIKDLEDARGRGEKIAFDRAASAWGVIQILNQGEGGDLG